MGFRFLPPPPPICLSLAFLFWVMVEIPFLSSSYNWYSSCNNTFDCGEITDVGFPFWGGSRPEGCGHPSLKLSCNASTTSINITGVNYRVLVLSENTRTLTIARADFADDLCPPKFLNTTLDYNLFDMVPGFQNISLIYCISSTGQLAGQFSCSSFQFGYILAGAVGPVLCNASVVIPISLSNSGSILDSSRAFQAIQQGFDVQWKVGKEACDECIKSKGVCGYDLSSNQTQCYCQGQAIGSDSCPVQNTGAPIPSPGADDEQYINCNSTFPCAHISTLSYPFWGENRPSYCGHPEFHLNCSGEVPLITIASTRYRVLEINGANTLKVSRLDYWEDVCPQYLVNSTLDETSFSYTSTSQELILFYGCLGFELIPSSTFTTRFNCTINGTDYANFFVTQNSVSTDVVGQMIDLCNRNVHLWIFNSEIQTLASNMVKESLISVIDAGFGLEWKINTSDLCDECQRSEGLCGSDPYSGAFTCFCKNGSSSSTCGSREGSSSLLSNPITEFAKGNKSVKAPIIIGISVGGAAILGLLLVCRMVFVRRKKKKLAFQSKCKDLPSPPSSNGISSNGISSPSTNLSKSISSYPYSKFSSEKGGSKSNYFGAQVFSYEELEEATDNFHVSKELGDGGFGTVYYGMLRDNRAVAVKRLYEHNLKRVEQFKNEVEILTRLQHPNLVKLYGCTSRHSQELLLVYEFVSNGTVADHLNGKRANSGLLTLPLRLRIAIETADALAYLHRSDIIHRDVKTDNILLDHNFHVKVADFGLSRLFPTNVTHVSTAPQGTPGYVDPEYYQCYHLTDKSDVYSFGVVLIELISSLQAVDTTRHRTDINLANMAVNKIQKRALVELVDPSLGFEKDYAARRIITLIAELAFQCLQFERDARPSMSEVLEALRGLENEELAARKAEVVDFGDDDVGLLRNMPSPFSSDDFVTDKWMKTVNRTM